jgi:starvation-inducible outer membrane lipoprotein
VPEIETSDTPGSGQDAPAGGGIVAPEVRSQTTEFSVTPPPVTQPTQPTVEDPPDSRFVRVGEPCDTPGAYAFTERYEPVVCSPRGQDDRLVWRRMFR